MLKRFSLVSLVSLARTLPLAIWVSILGCTHVETKQTSAAVAPVAPPVAPIASAYSTELSKAFAEAAANDIQRVPAQALVPGINLVDLQQLGSVGKGPVRVFVFPKISTQANKTNEDSGPLYKNAQHEKASHLGVPMEYDISTVAAGSCQDFVRKGPLSSFNGRRIFHVALAKDPNRRCAILDIVPTRLEGVDRALLRRDDQLRVRLFLDDTYNLQGYELEKFISMRKTRTVRVGTSHTPQGASSGLSLFPMDIPNFIAFGQKGAAHANLDVGTKIDNLAVAQVRRLFMGNFQPTRCPGTEMRYLDYYGTPIEVGWCDSQPFPQYMENSRFVAITQPMSVR